MLATITPTGNVQLTIGPTHPQYVRLVESIARARSGRPVPPLVEGPVRPPAWLDGDDDLVFATGAHAPKGYTKAKPLTIQGKQYVGGQFIPGEVLAKATPQERAAAGVSTSKGQPNAPTQPAVSKPVDPAAKTVTKEYGKARQKLASENLLSPEEQALPKTAASAYADPDQLFSAAAQKHLEFNAIMDHGQGIDQAVGGKTLLSADLDQALDRPGAVVVVGPIKGRPRATQKVQADYGGDWTKLHDMVRSTVAVDSVADIPKAMQAVREHFGAKGWTIAKAPKNRFVNPTLEGYGDLMLNVRSPDGMIGEVQIHLKPLLKAKQMAHHLYEQERTIGAKVKLEGRTEATPEEAVELARLVQEQRKIYGTGWLKAMGLHEGEGLADAHQLASLNEVWQQIHGPKWGQAWQEDYGVHEPHKGGQSDVSRPEPAGVLQRGRPASQDRGGAQLSTGTAAGWDLAHHARPAKVPDGRGTDQPPGVPGAGSAGAEDVDLEFAQAPKGYTKKRPLWIGGKSYTGGEFIPPEALAQATPEERAKVIPDLFDEPEAAHTATPTEPAKPAAAKPAKVSPAEGDDAQLRQALADIPEGELGVVGGFHVRRTGQDEYRLETQTGKGNVRGGADKVLDHLRRQRTSDRMYGKLRTEALERVKGYEEPSWMDHERAEAAIAGFRALKAGTPVVSLEEASYGRTGMVVKDDAGKTRVKLDGEDGYASNHVEPLDQKLSWRVPAAEKEAKPAARGLFEAEETAAPEEAKVARETGTAAYPQTTDRAERDALAQRLGVADVPRADVDALIAAVKKHDKLGHNLTSLVDVRKELGWDRQRADRAIQRARIERAIGLAAFEGRTPPPKEEMDAIKEAAVHEDDPAVHLIWAIVRPEWDKPAASAPAAPVKATAKPAPAAEEEDVHLAPEPSAVEETPPEARSPVGQVIHRGEGKNLGFSGVKGAQWWSLDRDIATRYGTVTTMAVHPDAKVLSLMHPDGSRNEAGYQQLAKIAAKHDIDFDPEQEDSGEEFFAANNGELADAVRAEGYQVVHTDNIEGPASMVFDQAVLKPAGERFAALARGETPIAASVPPEAKPKEPGFTGTTTDSLGRTYHWVDGKRVPGPKDETPARNKKTEVDETRPADTLPAEPPTTTVPHGETTQPDTGQAEQLAKPGGGSAQSGLPAQQRMGAPAAEEPDQVPAGTGAGAEPEQGTGPVPASPHVRGDATGRATGERRDAGGLGAGAGPGGTAAEESGRGGPADRVGTGREPGESGGSRPEPATPENPHDVAPGNFRYTDDDFYKGGLKTKFQHNLAALKVLQALQAEGRTSVTPDEQATLSKYVGWGQFPALFNEYGPGGHEWNEERAALQALITDEEWVAAKRSTINAHYTHPDVVQAHWQMAQRLGFQGGRFLETSAGIGYYLGLMPPELAGRTLTSAVELDPLTGKIAQLLYPHANVNVMGFQNYQAPDGFYDLVASNVPFAKEGPFDPRYAKHRASLHDYFFLKSADLTRPGGLVMHITSTGTLDKPNAKIRQELAKTCDLVAAVRFPGSTHKENAGTEVVTDLVILRKRLPGEKPVSLEETPPEALPAGAAGKFTGVTTDTLGRLYHWKDGKRVAAPDWSEVTWVPDPDGGEPIPVNKYFAEHPEQILGRLDRSGTMYQGESVNVSHTEDYDQRLADAIQRLPEGVIRPAQAPAERFAPEAMPAPGHVKDGGHVVGEDGKLYQRDGGALIEQEASADALARIRGHLDVRDAARQVIRDQVTGHDATDSRTKLNTAYDAFVKKFGYLHDRKNKLAFRSDPDHPVLLALEDWNDDAKKATKADLFKKDTISSVVPVEKVDSVNEGLGISLHETGGVDVDRIAALTGHDRAKMESHLVENGLAYQDPGKGWQPADQYLSGNVRRKLVEARAAAKADPKFQANVAALEKVQPEDVDHTEIDVKLGAPWVPPGDVQQFAADLLNQRPEHFAIGYLPSSGNWMASFSSKGTSSRGGQLEQQWSTPRKGFAEILEAALNNSSLNVYDKDAEGNAILNREATADAQAKAQEVKDKFRDWVWEDDDRRTRLHRYYNDNFNNLRPIRYDGSHLKFPGLNRSFKPHPHIPDFVWQVITTGKGLAAHEVGMGKTAAMIMSAMELRRLGLARKPAIACLKSNIEQITKEAQRLYPGANILSTADMFDAAKRKQTISRIATGDYDMVVLTHDHMDLLQMRPETVRKYIQEEIDELEAAKVASQKENPKKDNRVVKALEKAKLKLEARLEEALDASKKDDAVYFEETGIDHLFVDEAHHYKSLPCYTRQDRLKGVPTSRSDKATGMLMRTRWLQEQNNGRGVVFATGTPVANTMAELYNMQRYLQPQELKERGVHAFDAWANTFGDVQTKMEFTVAGEYKPVSRFARFVNIPELMQIGRQVMDVQRVENLPPRPDGKPTIIRPKRHDQIVLSPHSDAMKGLMASLQARAQNIGKGGAAAKGEDNMLVICTDGRKGSVDMRLLDPSAEDDPQSKTNLCVNKVLELYKQHPGKTQLIFSDVGVHPIGGKEGGANFHLYGDIIDKLVKGGIPRAKIADFSQLEGAKKEAAQAAMRRGDIVVALGGTKKLGTGVNVQNKVVAMHHLDVPWLPADVEQRDGRGWRHGNENKEVQVYRYVSEGSLDQTFWQIIGNKTGFIRQVLRPGQNVARVAKDEDTEELSPEQLMAAASGDERILEKVNLDQDVKELQAAALRHEREQAKLKDSVKAVEVRLPQLRQRAVGVLADAEHLAKQPEGFRLTVGNRTHTDREEATAALSARVAEVQRIHADTPEWQRYRLPKHQEIGAYRGLKLHRAVGPGTGAAYLLEGPSGQLYPTGDSLGSIEAVARRLPKLHTEAQAEAEKAEQDLAKVKGTLGRAFPKAAELDAKRKRVKELEAQFAKEKNRQQEDTEEGDGEEAEQVRPDLEFATLGFNPLTVPAASLRHAVEVLGQPGPEVERVLRQLAYREAKGLADHPIDREDRRRVGQLLARHAQQRVLG